MYDKIAMRETILRSFVTEEVGSEWVVIKYDYFFEDEAAGIVGTTEILSDSFILKELLVEFVFTQDDLVVSGDVFVEKVKR